MTQEQLGVQCIVQGLYNMWTGGPDDWTADPATLQCCSVNSVRLRFQKLLSLLSEIEPFHELNRAMFSSGLCETVFWPCLDLWTLTNWAFIWIYVVIIVALLLMLFLLSYCVVVVLQCLPLWPENSSGKICVRVVGSESTSKSFLFNQQDSGTLLSLDMVRVFPGPNMSAGLL